MLVAPGTQRETTGPAGEAPPTTVVGTTKGGKGGFENGADVHAEKLVPGGEKVESALSGWVRLIELIFRSTSSVFVMVIV